jgi:uncharacterized protein (TIGR00730 family)
MNNLKLFFKQPNPDIDPLIEQLISVTGAFRRPDIVRQMIIAALKAGQEAQSDIDLKLMNTTLKEMRFTSKAFSPYRDKRKVTVFGSARTRIDDPLYLMARRLGSELVEQGFMVITGAGDGIMQAVNEGAGPEASFGVNIQLPFEQKPNAIVAENPRLINYKYFFNRKVAFIKQADAVILFPGGFGTLDEAMEVLTLLQTGKQYPIPLILCDRPGGTYWREAVRFFEKEVLARGYMSEPDLSLLRIEQDPQQAARLVAEFYRNYHSMRYFGATLAIRLKAAPSTQVLSELERKFSHLLRDGGGIRLADRSLRERDEDQYAELAMLVVDHDGCNFTALPQLIDQLNRCVPRAELRSQP